MTLRPAMKSDASSLAAISIEVWIGTYLRNGVSGLFADYALTEFTAARFQTLLDDPRQTLIVSESEGGLTGFVRVTSDQPAPVAGVSSTEISTLYVQPRHHGKGLGAQLLTWAIQGCVKRGEPSVWLTTNCENTAAIGFYLAQGFQDVGRTHFRIKDQAYPNVVLARDLSTASL